MTNKATMNKATKSKTQHILYTMHCQEVPPPKALEQSVDSYRKAFDAFMSGDDTVDFEKVATYVTVQAALRADLLAYINGRPGVVELFEDGHLH